MYALISFMQHKFKHTSVFPWAQHSIDKLKLVHNLIQYLYLNIVLKPGTFIYIHSQPHGGKFKISIIRKPDGTRELFKYFKQNKINVEKAQRIIETENRQYRIIVIATVFNRLPQIKNACRTRNIFQPTNATCTCTYENRNCLLYTSDAADE